MQDKYLLVSKDEFFAFVDLEKACHRVSRNLAYLSYEKGGVPEKLVRIVEAAYHGGNVGGQQFGTLTLLSGEKLGIRSR